MRYRIHGMENVYFSLKVICTIGLLFLIVFGSSTLIRNDFSVMVAAYTTVFIYVMFILFFFLFQKMYLIAYMKGNGVAVSERQFPEIYSLYREMVRELGIKKTPGLFVLQQGGMLNAFAIRFSGSNYIAIYSDVFSLIKSDTETLKFVMGHELGHVKRGHMRKRFWTFLSAIVPFLNAAYSRSCEYTCDNIGLSVSKPESKRAIVFLAAGRDLYTDIDVEAYIEDAKENYSFIVKVMSLFMSHPYLPKRIVNLEKQIQRSSLTPGDYIVHQGV